MIKIFGSATQNILFSLEGEKINFPLRKSRGEDIRFCSAWKSVPANLMRLLLKLILKIFQKVAIFDLKTAFSVMCSVSVNFI